VTAAPGAPAGAVVCVDLGSTFTKASLVSLDDARVVATAEHRTTIGTDVLGGLDACRAALAAQDPRAADAEVLACSSAGGGLRIAVVGGEELVTAEAGRRVALSSGGRVVAVVAAAEEAVPALDADVVLLTGGTDGGNREVLLAAARGLVSSGWRGPVVVAGNADARAEVAAVLDDAAVPHVAAGNVVPRIGVLEPASARAAVREVFLAHVIGGKHLSASPRFTALVRGATPDVVLTGVELLAAALGDPSGVVVVDVGGATTDVHSVVALDPALRDASSLGSSGTEIQLSRDVVAPTPVTRTVEGDLGMRWSAPSTVVEGGLGDHPDLLDAAERRRADPGFLPATAIDLADDRRIAAAAASLACRRHAGRARVVVSPEGRVVERSGVDLRAVRLVVASGGVFRHGSPGTAREVLADALGVHEGGWQLPEEARVVVDTDGVLTAAGLLAADHPEVGLRLLRRWAGGPDH
jgi:uncharacterized protein (TIGR01319 family)